MEDPHPAPRRSQPIPPAGLTGAPTSVFPTASVGSACAQRPAMLSPLRHETLALLLSLLCSVSALGYEAGEGREGSIRRPAGLAAHCAARPKAPSWASQ